MKSEALHKIGFYIILGISFILPVFFLPITSEFYDFNKNFLLLISSAALLLIWVAGFIVDRQVKVTRSPLGLPVFAFMSAWIISTIARTPNRLDALINPGQTGTIFALSIYFFAATNFIRSKKQIEQLITAIIGSFSLLSAFALLWGIGLMEKVIPWNFAKVSLWSPTGNPLMVLVVLALLIPLLGILIFKHRDNSNRVLALSIALFLFVSASGVTAYRIFRGSTNRPLFLSQSAGWVIAMEALKSSPLIGTGADTYLIDFTRFKPVNYNMTQNWNLRFNSASNYYLHLLTTLGILGLAAFVFLAFRLVTMFLKTLKSSSSDISHIISMSASMTAILLLTSFFFVPPGVVTLFLFFTLLVITVASFKIMGSSLVSEANIDIIAASENGTKTPILPWISLALAIILFAVFGFPMAKSYVADVTFQQALTAVSKNDAKTAYEKLNAAVRLNPSRDTYRVAASQTYLLLANSAASKTNLTAEDRTTITNLIQQSIQEAKNAVALNPTKASNYENLANIYQNLLNFAQGADQWAVASYQQAIALDPTNPALRVSLGGIFYARNNFDEALRLFLQAADLKNNYANAYYNISAAYKQKKDYQNSYIAMQQVINIVDKTSADYLKAKGELEELGKLIGTTSQIPAAPAQTELETAQPLPTPRVNPPITLPSELGPETTPTPTQAPATIPLPTTAP